MRINVHRIEFNAPELSTEDYIKLKKQWCGVWEDVSEDDEAISNMISDVVGWCVTLVHYDILPEYEVR